MKVFTPLVILVVMLGGCTFVSDVDPGFPEDDYRTFVFDIKANKSTFGTDWVDCPGPYVDISPFSDIDSIIFEVNLRSASTDESTIAELYDVATGEAIPRTRLRSLTNFNIHAVRSGDLSPVFPQENFRVGIRFRSLVDGQYARINDGRIIVFYR